MTFVCGDIGGTRARFALAGAEMGSVAEFASADFRGPEALVRAWLAGSEVRPTAACLALAGPVREGRCVATNLPWVVEADALSASLGFPVVLINDFHAAALGARMLGPGGARRWWRGPPGPMRP